MSDVRLADIFSGLGLAEVCLPSFPEEVVLLSISGVSAFVIFVRFGELLLDLWVDWLKFKLFFDHLIKCLFDLIR